jgi:hypothetical protein
MTSPGSRPKKSGFMASIQSAMTPAIPADDGEPIYRPRSVTIASVLVMVAAVMFLLIGALSATSTGKQGDSYRTFYNSAVKQCTDLVGGIGTVVPTTVATPTAGPTTPLALTALPNSCRQITESTLSDSALSSYKTTLVVFSVVLIVIGLITGAAGWFMREGRKWTRRVLIGVVLIQLVLAFLFQVSNTVTLFATLLIVVGLSMTFLGKASGFFMSVALRKKQH